jgi:hypothetical protein
MTEIVITLTVKEPKGKGRPIIVSAAPAGEMPLILTGLFQDRHRLLDEIWIDLLTRKPQIVKVAAAKVADEKKVAEKDGDESEEAEAPAAETEEKPDQLVRPAEDLPVIEGDAPAGAPDEPQATLF